MPKIKQILAEGRVVKMFGVGQLLSPKLIEIVGEHGEFDALWIDAEHAGLGMKDIEIATMAARHIAASTTSGSPAAGDRLRLDHAFARSRRRRGDDQHGPRAGRRRASRPMGQVLPQGRARDERRQPRRPLRPDSLARVCRQGQRPDLRRHPDRDRSPAIALGRRDRRGPRSRPPSSSAPADIKARSWESPATSENPKCTRTPSSRSRKPVPRPASAVWGIKSPGGPEYAARMLGWGCKMFVFGFDIHVKYMPASGRPSRATTPSSDGLIDRGGTRKNEPKSVR